MSPNIFKICAKDMIPVMFPSMSKIFFYLLSELCVNWLLIIKFLKNTKKLGKTLSILLKLIERLPALQNANKFAENI